MIKRFLFALTALCSFQVSANLIGYADVVLAFDDDGQLVQGEVDIQNDPFGPLTYSTDINGNIIGEVADAVLGFDTNSYLSLRSGQSITLGFINENIIDGIGADIFVNEFGNASETAQIYVSSDNINFFLVGIADGNQTSEFDLSDISFTSPVTSVRIVSTSTAGSSPGFDLRYVQALNRVVVETNAPATLGIMIVGLVLLARRRQQA